MDLPATIGAVIGTGAATFVGTWITLLRPLSKRVNEVESTNVSSSSIADIRTDVIEIRQENAGNRLTKVETQHHGIEETLKQINERLLRIETNQRAAVTDEEFGTYVAETTKTVNQLTEKVGRAIGIIESWGRSR